MTTYDMNVPGSYPRSKMISEFGVTMGGFFINMESERIIVNTELSTITPAAQAENSSARFLLILNQIKNLHAITDIRVIVKT